MSGDVREKKFAEGEKTKTVKTLISGISSRTFFHSKSIHFKQSIR